MFLFQPLPEIKAKLADTVEEVTKEVASMKEKQAHIKEVRARPLFLGSAVPTPHQPVTIFSARRCQLVGVSVVTILPTRLTARRAFLPPPSPLSRVAFMLPSTRPCADHSARRLLAAGPREMPN